MSDQLHRSFRLELAGRLTLMMAVALSIVLGSGYLVLRRTLDRQIDATIVSVASIQAASITDDPTGEMRFHEWNLTPEEAASVREINRWAQVWNEDGHSLLRSQFLERDLPLDDEALRAAMGGELTWTEQTFDDLDIRSLYYPLGRLGTAHEPHVLQVSAPLTARNGTLQAVAVSLLLIGLLVSGATFAGGWWLAGRAVAPVRAITRQAEEIGAETLGQRITALPYAREYARLVEVLNTMLDRLDGAFEAQRRFTGDASHELRSPLTALRGELELAVRRERTPEEYRRVLGSALEEAERLSHLAGALLTLARSDAGAMVPQVRAVDLLDVVTAAVARSRPEAESKNITITVDAARSVMGTWDPDLLERAVFNIVDNAIKYTTPGGRVRITLDGDSDVARIAVADSGPGVREADRDRIFERFYRSDVARTDSASAGSGLGLSIVHAIVRAHEGEICVRDVEGGGALFIVQLPRTVGAGRRGPR